ncbi:hypothetical protein [Virgibacillus senegalensis]|uniref:hypothetical protein n=1 Tax=Virgibacillus senegalensis TaxID=1499679 RepID=UPI00069DC417|nr:hypothetical protein [Virgibacillus senegalensis]
MKKVIGGAVYNTETAKKICEQLSEEIEYEKGANVKKSKQLFKTKSGKYFLFIKSEFTGYIAVNNDDLDPEFEEAELEEEKIKPVPYELALQFASETITSNPESKTWVGKYFPELIDGIENNKKIQKKIYISEKASWYLEMMLTDSDDTNSSLIEKLITDEYHRLYEKGLMKRDPYFEMEANK